MSDDAHRRQAPSRSGSRTDSSSRGGSRTAPEKETGRIEAFSDGVFAIAITLLILDIKVPAPELVNANHVLFDLLLKQWPNYLAYFISFAVILVMWVNHHRIFTLVKRTDHPFFYWNGLLLMLVAIVPFPTALLAAYTWSRVAVAVYAGHGLLIAIAFTGLWRYAIKNDRLLAADVDRAEIKRMTKQYRYGIPTYTVALVLAFIWPYASIGLCLSVALFFAFRGFVARN